MPNNSQSDKLPGPAIGLLAAGSSTARNDKLKDLGAIVEISDQAERLQKLSEKHHQALKDGVTSLSSRPRTKKAERLQQSLEIE
jgi:hypothetical protein